MSQSFVPQPAAELPVNVMQYLQEVCHSPLDTYRAALEACLAYHIQKRFRESAQTATLPRKRDVAYISGEIDGLCIALRMLGGYGNTTFNLSWALDDARPTIDWKKVLLTSYNVD
jgi:hypothetical protein